MLSESTTKLIGECFVSLEQTSFHGEVYSACLELGSSHASTIAQKVKLPRSTVYGILRDLVKLGLISEIKEDGKLQFNPSPPERLLDLLQQKQNEVEINGKNLQIELPLLRDIFQAKNLLFPNVRFYQGKDGLKTVLYDSLSTKEILWICQGNDQQLTALADDPQYLTDFINETITRGIRTKELLEDNPANREYQTLFQSRNNQIIITPKVTRQKFYHVDKLIYDNKISYISHDNVVGVIIEDETLAKFEREQFNALWEYYSSLR